MPRRLTIRQQVSFLDIPNEILALIVERIELDTLQHLRVVCKRLHEVVNIFVKEIVSIEGVEGEIIISAKNILTLQNVEVISTQYQINIINPDEITKLSQHPKLQYAAFNFTTLDGDFYSYIIEFLSCLVIKKNYDLSFIHERENKAIRLVGKQLILATTNITPNFAPLMTSLSHLNITCYRGPLNEDVALALAQLTTLTSLDILSPENNLHEYIVPLLTPKIKHLTFDYPIDTLGTSLSIISCMVCKLVERNLSFPYLISFGCGDSRYIREISLAFPNLTTITLSYFTIQRTIPCIDNYQRIIIDKEFYIDKDISIIHRFPPHLRQRITLIIRPEEPICCVCKYRRGLCLCT